MLMEHLFLKVKLGQCLIDFFFFWFFWIFLLVYRELGTTNRSNENRKASMSLSPEKEDRYYTTRGSVGLDDHNKSFTDIKEDNKKFVWPKLLIPLSSKEKEEDFMAMKGCKLPQRPKKRAKVIQKTILVSSFFFFFFSYGWFCITEKQIT